MGSVGKAFDWRSKGHGMSGPVKDLISVASKFGDFKRLTYCHSLILAVSQFNVP